MKKQLTIAIALLAAISSGCSSSSESSDGAGDTVGFQGVYTSTSDGPMDAIAFTDSTHYMMMPSGCRAQDCAELGSFRYDRAAKELQLTSTAGVQRSIHVEVVSTSRITGALLTRDIVDDGPSDVLPGGQSNVQPGGQSNVQPGGQLNVQPGGVSQIIQQIVEAILNAQQMKQQQKQDDDQRKQDDQKKDDDKKLKPECQQNVPTPATPPDQALLYWGMCPQGVLTPG